MVELFHCQLNASVVEHTSEERWIEVLLFFFLSIRSAMKKEMKCTSAELVYGSPLLLPDEFFNFPRVYPADPLRNFFVFASVFLHGNLLQHRHKICTLSF